MAFWRQTTVITSNRSDKHYEPKIHKLKSVKQKMAALMTQPPPKNPHQLTYAPSALQATWWSSPYFNPDGEHLLDNQSDATSHPPSSCTANQPSLLRLTRSLCTRYRKSLTVASTNNPRTYYRHHHNPNINTPSIFPIHLSPKTINNLHTNHNTTLNLQTTLLRGSVQLKLLSRLRSTKTLNSIRYLKSHWNSRRVYIKRLQLSGSELCVRSPWYHSNDTHDMESRS
jgi:hypothetical protein